MAVDAQQEASFRAALGPGALKLLAAARLEWLDALPRMSAQDVRVSVQLVMDRTLALHPQGT